MENELRLFPSAENKTQSSVKEKTHGIKNPDKINEYNAIKKSIEELAGIPLAKFGVIPFESTHIFFAKLEGALLPDICYARLSDSHSNSLTVVKKRANGIEKTPYVIPRIIASDDENNIAIIRATYQVINKSNIIINCITAISDFEFSDYFLTKLHLNSFKKELNQNPQAVLEKIEQQTQLIFSNKTSFAGKSANLFAVNDKVYIFSLVGKDEVAASQKNELRVKFFLISSNQIAMILNLKKLKLTSQQLLESLNGSVAINDGGGTEMSQESTVDELYQLIEKNEEPVAITQIIKKLDVAVLTKPNSFGLTLLHVAAQKGDLSLVNLLINKSVKIRAEDQKGKIPLHHAVINNHENQELLKRLAGGSNLLGEHDFIDSCDNAGHTALFYAVTQGNPAIIKILVECGASRRIYPNEVEGMFKDIFIDAIGHHTNYLTLRKTLEALLEGFGAAAIDEVVQDQGKNIIKGKNAFSVSEQNELCKFLTNPKLAESVKETETPSCSIM